VTYRRLIYTSRVARSVRYADAEDIALRAAARNEQAGLTGLLLYTPSHFVQVLEGAPREVAEAIARIGRDPRHSQLRVVDDREVDEREFASWAMAARFCAAQSTELQQLDLGRALDLLRAARDGAPTDGSS